MSEQDKDRCQELATELYGRGAAISEDKTPNGWDFTVWTPKGAKAHVHSTTNLALPDARLTLIRTLEAKNRETDADYR